MDVRAARNEVAELGRLRTRFGEIATRTDRARLQELVALRRELSEQVGRLMRACDPLFAAGAAMPLAADYRSRLSRLRHALALHQASWPAVAIDSDIDGYRQSMQRTRAAESALIDWLGRVFAGVEGSGRLPAPGD